MQSLGIIYEFSLPLHHSNDFTIAFLFQFINSLMDGFSIQMSIIYPFHTIRPPLYSFLISIHPVTLSPSNCFHYYVLVPKPLPNIVSYTYFETHFQVGMAIDRNETVFHIYRETEEYQACREKFEKVGWVLFLEKFK
jgi:hypothetical protein